MSNDGRFKDMNPTVISSGKITAIKDESTANCINPKQIGRVLYPPIFPIIQSFFSNFPKKLKKKIAINTRPPKEIPKISYATSRDFNRPLRKI